MDNFKSILIIFLLCLFVNNQVPKDKSINSCGQHDYNQPKSPDNCKENDEICCFVNMTNGIDVKTFCASSPSKISKSDVEEEIFSYTGYNLVELKCNKGRYLNSFIYFFILFILF